MKFTDLVDFVGNKPTIFQGSKRYVSTGALKSTEISYNDIEMIEYETRPSRANLQVKKDSILFAKMAYTDKRLVIDDVTSKNIYSTGFFAVQARSGIITKQCLYYLLGSESFKNQKDRNSSGATQKAINNKGLQKIKVKLPKYEIQELIGSKLNKIDQIISYKKQQLQEYDQLIKSRFVEMFGDPLINNKGWKMQTFMNICTVRQGLQIPIRNRYTEEFDNCYKYITVAYLNGKKDEEFIQNPKSNVICTKDDILMTRTGNTGMVITGVEGVFHNNFFLIDFDRTRYEKLFLYHFLNLDYVQADIIRRADISTIPDLNHGEFYNIGIYEPPIRLQKQFAMFVKQVDKMKFAVQKSLDETQILFDSLMQEYFG